jgi:FdhD protein
MARNQHSRTAVHIPAEGTTAPRRRDLPLIGEEPLSIRVQGHPYAVVMRTPGDEMDQVGGFCLTEGIADRPDDIVSMGFCDGEASNVVAVTLRENRRRDIASILDRRGFISQTSCGICGKEVLEDLRQRIPPIEHDRIRIDGLQAMRFLENLSDFQPLRNRTRAAHAAAIHAADGTLLSAAEDVGRHNALDKAIGRLFLDGRLDGAAAVVLSSRLSYELVQKSARARIPVLLSLSRPTALAVELAEALCLTVACRDRGSGLLIFCGENRIRSS